MTSIIDYLTDKFFKNDKDIKDNNKSLIIKYSIYWIIGVILITLLYLLVNMVCNHIGNLSPFDSVERINMRKMTPSYPPPLTNFIDSNDFFTL